MLIDYDFAVPGQTNSALAALALCPTRACLALLAACLVTLPAAGLAQPADDSDDPPRTRQEILRRQREAKTGAIVPIHRLTSGGLTPRFQVIDGRGDRYIIKFDPVGIPELSSAAEIIGTELFHAIGYSTPENYIATVDPEAGLVIEPDTLMEDEFGDESPLTRAFLRRILRSLPRLPDGRIRVTASKYLDGRPLGPFRYHGTCSDDPNDVIPHEHRRELRGLRLFAARSNNDDTRSQNTQASWVEENGGRFVRHHLLDFGSAFGSGSVDLQLPNLSFHYWLDMNR